MQPAAPPTYDEFRARLRARQEVRTPSGEDLLPVFYALML